MLTNVEESYIKHLISTYKQRGYDYYVCHTISDNNNTSNDYDVCIYFSKKEITCLADNYFEIQDGVRLYIDSNAKSNYNYNAFHYIDNFNGSVVVDVSEFVYTNAKVNHSLTAFPLNPDLLVDSTENVVSLISMFILIIVFLYMFIHDLFFRTWEVRCVNVKKIICIILVLLCTFGCLDNTVQAVEEGIIPLSSIHESIDGAGDAYRLVEFGQYDIEKDAYLLQYRIFTANGMKQGTVYVNNELYNKKHFFIIYHSDVDLIDLYCTDASKDSIDVKISYDYNYKCIVLNYEKCETYRYDFDNNVFNFIGSSTSSSWSASYRASPNDFLYQKGMNIYYSHGSNKINYTSAIDYSSRLCPNLTFQSGSGFRLYLNEFINSDEVNDIYEVHDTLKSLNLFIYDLDSKQYYIDNTNLLSISTIDQDVEGRSYIDIKFNDLLQFMLRT